ncbi:MAG TPA: Rho termination factor N-terminal domain-containing protein [Solirubrobacteraceae bacterium]|jgi:transcription termination factor Rho|nr:Rho termination factor N-terminal domain-containing protein [Solirubrobacteraceae bacterium]
MSVLDRATLEESTLADLHAIASELSIDGYRRLRKSDLIATLLAHQLGEERPEPSGPAEAAEAADADEAVEADEESATGAAARRRRGRRGGRGRSATSRSGGATEDAEDEAPAAPAPAKQDEPVIVEGVVELLPNGSGFARVSPPEPSDEDVYISAAQVKRCELVNGDRVSGPRRGPHRSERFPSMVRIDTVNGRPAEELADRGRFDDLPSEFPGKRFELGSDDATLKAVEFLTPFGRGSRVTITGDAWAGKSYLLSQLATILPGLDGVTVFVALAGVRPEELSEWAEAPVKPGAAVSFAASAEAQDNAVELVVDQARRLAARGSDAVVLIDTLDGLHPLSARKALASARKLKDGGSLTVIATSSKPIGGETTVIALDAALTLTGRYPAVNLPASGTLRAELLVGQAGAKAIAKERVKAQK